MSLAAALPPIHNPAIDYHAIAPELVLAGAIFLVLIADLALPPARKWWSMVVAFVGVLATLATTLTLIGAMLGILLGLVTARYLDGILTSFPGLPASFSFFVPRADVLSLAALVLLATGSLAGLYPAWLASRAPIAATLRAEAT